MLWYLLRWGKFNNNKNGNILLPTGWRFIYENINDGYLIFIKNKKYPIETSVSEDNAIQ